MPFTYTPPYGLDTSLYIGSGRPGLDGVTGAFTFATMTILVDAAAAHRHIHLRFTPADISDDSFNGVNTAIGGDYQITVASSAPPGGGGGGGGGEPDPGEVNPTRARESRVKVNRGRVALIRLMMDRVTHRLEPAMVVVEVAVAATPAHQTTILRRRTRHRGRVAVLVQHSRHSLL